MGLQTISQAAKELGLTETHVRKMIRKGLWPCYRLGEKTKGVRVDIEEIKDRGRLSTTGEGKKRRKNERIA